VVTRRRGFCLGVSYAQESRVPALPIFGSPVYTLKSRTTKFGMITHIWRGAYFKRSATPLRKCTARFVTATAEFLVFCYIPAQGTAIKRRCCLTSVCLTSVAYIRLAGGVCGRPAGWRVLADRARLDRPSSRLPLRASVAGLYGGYRGGRPLTACYAPPLAR